MSGSFDGVGERRVGRHEDRERVGAVLGLREQVGRDDLRVGGRVGEDEAFRGAGGQVDADFAGQFQLGGRDPGAAGADDAVDRVDALVGQAEGQRGDRLGAAGDEERVDAEQRGRRRDDRVDPAVRTGWRGDDDPFDAGDLRRNDGHDERGGQRGGTAGDVAADAPIGVQRRSMSTPSTIVVRVVCGRCVSANRRTLAMAASSARAEVGVEVGQRVVELGAVEQAGGRRAGRRRRGR